MLKMKKLDTKAIILVAEIGLCSIALSTLSNLHPTYSANQHQRKIPRYRQEREAVIPEPFEGTYLKEEYERRI